MNDRAVDALSWAIVLVAVLAFIDPWLGYCTDLIALGIAFAALGALFVLAFYRPEASRMLRALVWICEHLSAPAGKRMAFFWSFFFVFLGVLALGQGFGLFNVSGFYRGRIVFDTTNAEPRSCRP